MRGSFVLTERRAKFSPVLFTLGPLLSQLVRRHPAHGGRPQRASIGFCHCMGKAEAFVLNVVHKRQVSFALCK